jgi:uncharacterized membrane protein YphA (DoxX/SURF4 family)
LLRTVVGASAMIQGAASLVQADSPALGMWVVGALMITGGAALFVGFLTPGTGALVGVSIAMCWFPTPAPRVFLDGIAAALVVADAAAIALLGPGAFSVDARLFGRREIVIRPDTHPRES